MNATKRRRVSWRSHVWPFAVIVLLPSTLFERRLGQAVETKSESLNLRVVLLGLDLGYSPLVEPSAPGESK
jgi:hypothetical protein